jgi:catechol 2,3-dioxygenase-like lactoylglutathione lyase family enzyme
MNIDHITAVVANLCPAEERFTALLGDGPSNGISLPGMEIRTFSIGNIELHVDAPTGPGLLEDHYRRHGPGLHHLALRVDDLDASLAMLHRRGLRALGPPIETAPGLREVFLAQETIGGILVQLVERRCTTATLDGGAVARLVQQSR